jgi:hypothetical protein
VLLIVPLIFANRTFVRMWLLVSILASLPLAAKYGTGAYHFLPFVPLIVFAATDRTESRDGQHGSVLAFIAAATVVAAFQLPQWISRADDLPAREITGELRGISSRHRGAIAMGYGGNYRLSFFRPLLVFDGHPYHLDGASLMDRHWSGSAFPRASIDLVRECRVGTWVIPVGGPPFVLPNAYPVGGDVIPLEFRRAFESRYRLVESGRWFDVWRCR